MLYEALINVLTLDHLIFFIHMNQPQWGGVAIALHNMQLLSALNRVITVKTQPPQRRFLKFDSKFEVISDDPLSSTASAVDGLCKCPI